MDEKVRRAELVAAVFTKNEAANIGECIESLAGISTISVIDSNSTDGTQLIAKQSGATVTNFDWDGKYPRKKQWTLNLLSDSDWVLMMDADLRAYPELIDEIKVKIQDTSVSAILIPIDYWFGGKRLKFGVKVKYFGALRPDMVKFPDVEIPGDGYGDIEFHYQPQVSGKIITSQNRIIHRDNDPLSSWVERHNKYAVYQAKINRDIKTKKIMDHNKTFQGKLFSKTPFKSFFFFLFSYFMLGGFLDGKRGFQYNYLLAHHYYLQSIYLDDFSSISN
jgi:glycosyltransferase involved in cell wall biosynthesis